MIDFISSTDAMTDRRCLNDISNKIVFLSGDRKMLKVGEEEKEIIIVVVVGVRKKVRKDEQQLGDVIKKNQSEREEKTRWVGNYHSS